MPITLSVCWRRFLALRLAIRPACALVNPTAQQFDLRFAERFAAERHAHQRRKGAGGEPYINHPLAVAHLLADTYSLYLKTHNFHWNVTGPMFNTLHTMFMVQYTELWNAVDPIAERIRSLGHPAPGSYGQFGKLSSLPDAPATPPKALDMVRVLVAGHEAVARTARTVFPLADHADDQPTADLLTQRLDVHEKTAWMLRSLLETE